MNKRKINDFHEVPMHKIIKYFVEGFEHKGKKIKLNSIDELTGLNYDYWIDTNKQVAIIKLFGEINDE